MPYIYRFPWRSVHDLETHFLSKHLGICRRYESSGGGGVYWLCNGLWCVHSWKADLESEKIGSRLIFFFWDKLEPFIRRRSFQARIGNVYSVPYVFPLKKAFDFFLFLLCINNVSDNILSNIRLASRCVIHWMILPAVSTFRKKISMHSLADQFGCEMFPLWRRSCGSIQFQVWIFYQTRRRASWLWSSLELIVLQCRSKVFDNCQIYPSQFAS